MKPVVLLVGGDLCEHVAARLPPSSWRCIGMRRRAMGVGAPSSSDDTATIGGAGAGSPIRWVQADLSRADSLSALHAASLAPITHILYAPSPDRRTPEDYARIYPQGLRALLGALPQPAALRRCVLVDSTAVWGPAPVAAGVDHWVDEHTPPRPDDFRGALMLEAESILHALPPGCGVALRLAGLYGPQRLRLITGLRAGRVTAPAGPGHWANRIHVEDAASACAHLLTLHNPQRCYIGTDQSPMPTAELYDALARMAGGPPPDRQARPPSGKRLSNARLRASGWAPRWPRTLDGYAACLAHKAV